MSALVPSPPPDASSTLRGLVSLAAQTWAGVKTFTSALVASAGIQVASLFNTNGTGGTDVVITAGTTVADASVNANSKLVSIQTGIGGTPVEQFSFLKGSVLRGDTANPNISLTNALGVQIRYGAGANLQVGSPAGTGITLTSTGGNFIGSTQGAGSTDVGNRIGFMTADGSVNASAKLLSLRTGIGGTEVEKLYVDKGGNIRGTYPSCVFRGSSASNGALSVDDTVGSSLSYGSTIITLDSGRFNIAGAGGATSKITNANGSFNTDVCMTLGTTRTDAGTDASAKLVSIGTGIGGTYVESLWAKKNGVIGNDTTAGVTIQAQGTNIASFTAGGALSPLVNVTYAIYLNAGANSGIQWGATATGMRLTSEAADGATALGLFVNTVNAWSNAGARLASFRTANTIKLEVDASGALVSPLGAGATDVVMKLGSSVADASLNAAATILKVASGIGGSEVIKLGVSSAGVMYRPGTDTSGTPGNATVNKPSGIAAIASGATTCTITNSLVPATATRRIKIFVTFQQDHGAARYWVVQTTGGGSFVVTLPTAATANAIFSWGLEENI